MTAAQAALTRFVAEELARPVPPAVATFAAELAARGGQGVVGVLFYGSALRTGATDGLLDFYVLLDRFDAWEARPLIAKAGARLPPNVEYAETTAAGMTLRSKLAVMTLDQFRRHARHESRDTTIWARFAQPCALVWSRDAFAAERVAEAVSIAIRGASWWAAHLGPARGSAADFWLALFARTYSSELRVESGSRPGSIVEAAPERYGAALRLGWAAEGLAFREDLNELAPAISEDDRQKAEGAWKTRKRLAKPLNLLRLAKAAFTFSGGADYIAWKIERHSGHKEVVTPFQRRHPLLAAGPVLWRLWRKGVLR
ncbi:hypothetical protein [Chenggangzhangella methanolivorans]|uniref:Uncharacterized protein n=1 Tax=Chenggangzhangella methanolivorans TaxID=1437009 RepID=A0A9E6UIZ7_9HYPH|nr:hypothetical protein [Chenggangzhangella methanolivorans]QZO01413.1 hypothetical protein K6K41_08165 [Chenggangzhangella methanolivorans]